MSRISSIALGILAASLVTGEASAQWNVARFGTEPNRIFTTSGLDPAVVTSVGYARVVPVARRDLQLSGEVGLVTAKVDTRDFRAKMGAQVSLWRWRSVNLTGSVSAITRGTENTIYRGINFGADFAATVGVYRPTWFVAGEAGKDKAIITHVTHTDFYRSLFPDARNGWYLDAGGTLRNGIAAGISRGRAEFVTRLGFQRTEDYNSMVPPVYASAGMGWGY
jgi:hypothetical protein